MRRALLILAGIAASTGLSACSVTGGTPALSADARQAERLAALLAGHARRDDPALAGARDEMTALEWALSAPRAGGEPEPEPETPIAPARVAAPGTAGGLSLFHAIHLASYREARHGAEGWTALQSQHASLEGLEARLVPADLGAQGIYLRLLAGPFDTPEAAGAACGPIQSRGSWCAVLPFDGEPLIP
ncbi:MAG: hypothetical protein ACK4NO_05215 [Glycocaulis sp.]